MKTILASIFTTVLIVAMTLAAMFLLVRATVYVTSLESPLYRAAAMGTELLLGVILLLGTTWLATHLAVRIFSPKEPPSRGSSEPLSKALAGLSQSSSSAPVNGGRVV
jgi:hypothetical protein